MLTNADKKILDVESRPWRHAGRKLEAIRTTGLTEVQYYQRLNALCRDGAALAYAPAVVGRLNRLVVST